MWSCVRFHCLLGAGALVAATLAFAPSFTLGSAAPGTAKPGRTVSYLKEVRPILAQHCYQCHGPDDGARKAKLRLDLKDQARARRHGQRVIAPGDPAGSLAWGRITARDEGERMPPVGK